MVFRMSGVKSELLPHSLPILALQFEDIQICRVPISTGLRIEPTVQLESGARLHKDPPR
jgi:hypothetical protein